MSVLSPAPWAICRSSSADCILRVLVSTKFWARIFVDLGLLFFGICGF